MNSSPNPEANLPAQSLLNALDTQIKFEAGNQRNDGWTRWAIWGAIAALVWIGSDLWCQPDLSLSRMAAVSILVFVMRRFLEEAIWVLLPNACIELGPARFRLTADTIYPLRPEMMFTALQYLLIISALAGFKIQGQWFLWTYAIGAFAISMLTLICGAFVIGAPKNVSLRTAINVGTFIQLIWLRERLGFFT